MIEQRPTPSIFQIEFVLESLFELTRLKEGKKFSFQN